MLIAVPGPSIMFLVGQTLSVGGRAHFGGVVGNAIGTYGVGVVLAVGIGSLILRSGEVMLAIKLFGAVVLCAIGLRLHPRPAAAPRRRRTPRPRPGASRWSPG